MKKKANKPAKKNRERVKPIGHTHAYNVGMSDIPKGYMTQSDYTDHLMSRSNCITGFASIKPAPQNERVLILRTIEKLTDLL